MGHRPPVTVDDARSAVEERHPGMRCGSSDGAGTSAHTFPARSLASPSPNATVRYPPTVEVSTTPQRITTAS